MQVDTAYLATCEVQDEDSNTIKVGTLWSKQSVVFIFLRHFACIECRSHAVQIWNDRDRYIKAGSRLVLIGSGQPHFIKTFKEDLGIQEAPIYTDPKLQTFRAAGFKRGFLAALRPASLARGLGLHKAGFRQGTNYQGSGDWWQMGGVLVVKPDGSVAFHHINQKLGDYPPDKDVIESQD